jgi:galactoside O-acetyltransferase
MTNRERKENGLPYRYDDPSIMDGQLAFQELLYDYNRTRPTEREKRQRLLKEMFAEIGEGCHVETPLHANWGCRNVHFGKGIYCNANVAFVDDADIYVGDDCLIAPNVVISASGHPILPVLRERNYVFNAPVHIGKNVWLGAGVQVMPGVRVGDNSVIGAGSVVTGDIPANVVAFGAPCRAVREIGAQDREYYAKGKKLDVWE